MGRGRRSEGETVIDCIRYSLGGERSYVHTLMVLESLEARRHVGGMLS